MSYKAFEDFYRDAIIKHLLLDVHNGVLISPPFSTEKCKDYNKVAIYDKGVHYIDLDLPQATSKTNAIAQVKDSSWLIPYAIWDDFDVIVELKDFKPNYYNLNQKGKGQFYSVASDGARACSFPLGYENTSYIIYIDSNGLKTKEFKTENKKCHMGVIHCNGKFWSMPRGDYEGYNNLVSFDGETIETFNVPVDNTITRKYTDLNAVDKTLYSLPYGETSGLSTVIEFDTNSKKMKAHELEVFDFAKKYNVQVLVEDTIIGLPYGDEHSNDSSWGVFFNTTNKSSKAFNIGISHGGKYRYRSGLEYKGKAIFLPAGTPSCPIISVDLKGNIQSKFYNGKLFGRPIIFNDTIHTIVYDILQKRNYIVQIDENLNCKELIEI